MTVTEPPPETTRDASTHLPEPVGRDVSTTVTEAVAPPARRSRSRWWQLAIVVGAALIVALGLAIAPALLRPVADQTPEPTKAKPGTFRPSAAQWAGLKIEPVQLVSFRPEQVTEGNIAIDDDLTTPVFSPYSGHVMRL